MTGDPGTLAMLPMEPWEGHLFHFSCPKQTSTLCVAHTSHGALGQDGVVGGGRVRTPVRSQAGHVVLPDGQRVTG